MKFVYCSAFIVDLSKKLFRCFFSLFCWAACVRALFLYHICDCRGVFRPPTPVPSRPSFTSELGLRCRSWKLCECTTFHLGVDWISLVMAHDDVKHSEEFRILRNCRTLAFVRCWMKHETISKKWKWIWFEFPSHQHISIHLSSFSVLHLVSSLIFRKTPNENVFRESYYFFEIPIELTKECKYWTKNGNSLNFPVSCSLSTRLFAR